MVLRSKVKCPHCGYEKVETMPTDYCQISYRCESCGNLLIPKKGDCCIFCSFGDEKCPSMQEGAS